MSDRRKKIFNLLKISQQLPPAEESMQISNKEKLLSILRGTESEQPVSIKRVVV